MHCHRTSFFKMGQPRPIFCLFSSLTTENYFSSHQDSNLDRRSRGRVRRPLDHHHHRPKQWKVFPGTKFWSCLHQLLNGPANLFQTFPPPLLNDLVAKVVSTVGLCPRGPGFYSCNLQSLPFWNCMVWGQEIMDQGSSQVSNFYTAGFLLPLSGDNN